MAAITFAVAKADDFERLFALRIAVMREHLERHGRFEPDRARALFWRRFAPAHTRLVYVDQAFAGCVSLTPGEAGIELQHVYLDPSLQRQGIGGRILDMLLGETDTAGQSVRLGVLKQSPARRFDERRGFAFDHSTEWDDYLSRPARQLAV